MPPWERLGTELDLFTVCGQLFILQVQPVQVRIVTLLVSFRCVIPVQCNVVGPHGSESHRVNAVSSLTEVSRSGALWHFISRPSYSHSSLHRSCTRSVLRHPIDKLRVSQQHLRRTHAAFLIPSIQVLRKPPFLGIGGLSRQNTTRTRQIAVFNFPAAPEPPQRSWTSTINQQRSAR